MGSAFERRVTALAGVAGVLGLLLLPVEHVHLSHHHDHDHRDVVHRHFEPHHPITTEATIDHDNDDDDVEWLTTAFTSPTPSASLVGLDHNLLKEEPPAAPLRPDSQETIQTVPASAHDPPWQSTLCPRAPPFLSI